MKGRPSSASGDRRAVAWRWGSEEQARRSSSRRPASSSRSRDMGMWSGQQQFEDEGGEGGGDSYAVRPYSAESGRRGAGGGLLPRPRSATVQSPTTLEWGAHPVDFVRPNSAGSRRVVLRGDDGEGDVDVVMLETLNEDSCEPPPPHQHQQQQQRHNDTRRQSLRTMAVARQRTRDVATWNVAVPMPGPLSYARWKELSSVGTDASHLPKDSLRGANPVRSSFQGLGEPISTPSQPNPASSRPSSSSSHSITSERVQIRPSSAHYHSTGYETLLRPRPASAHPGGWRSMGPARTRPSSAQSNAVFAPTPPSLPLFFLSSPLLSSPLLSLLPPVTLPLPRPWSCSFSCPPPSLSPQSHLHLQSGTGSGHLYRSEPCLT
jgi:hypothetical protein